MTPPQPTIDRHNTAEDTSAAVDLFLAGLEHPFFSEIKLLRSIITASDDTVREGIKWKAPSWRTTEYFATTNLRVKGGIGLILHLGAKVRDLPEGGLQISDPEGLLKWLAPDRASVEFRSRGEIEEKTEALRAVLGEWVAMV